MTALDLTAIRRALAEATPGDARCPIRLTVSGLFLGTDLYLGERYIAGVSGDERDRDYHLIVLLRNNAEALLAEIERLRKVEALAKIVRAVSPSAPCVACGVGFGEPHDSNCAAAALDAALGGGR